MSLRDLQAPSEHGAVLAEPSLDEVGDLVRTNRQRQNAPAPDVLGRPWNELRRRARTEALAAAQEYLRLAGEPLPEEPTSLGHGLPTVPPALLLAGHQPELFHPGVWVKNFALCGLARRHGAWPVNLIIDSDTVKATALRIPSYRGEPSADGDAVALTVPFDRWTGEIPYEERVVADEPFFAEFPARAEPAFHGWGFVPLLASFWAEVRRVAERTVLLGERFTAARRTFERRWGCHNLEVPVSHLGRTEGFAWFVSHLLVEAPRFHTIYNECLAAYRKRYGVRSHNHPVPELVRDGDWREVPFWAWHTGQSRRGRLMVRRRGAELQTRAGSEPGPSLPFDPARPQALVAAWRELEARGFKVRTRALTSTLFARLFLAELFIHGLGGAKYDELTDEIVRRFYRMEPPRFLTLTATLRLPLPLFPSRPAECQTLLRQRRDVTSNPQRHLPPAVEQEPAVRRLVAEKADWIARRPATARGRRERFRTLRSLTAQLQPWVADREQRLRHDLTRCQEQLHANAILQRRDYAFCLYPEAMLRPALGRFLLGSGPAG